MVWTPSFHSCASASVFSFCPVVSQHAGRPKAFSLHLTQLSSRLGVVPVATDVKLGDGKSMLGLDGEPFLHLPLQSLERRDCNAFGVATDVDVDVANASCSVSCEHLLEVEGPQL